MKTKIKTKGRRQARIATTSILSGGKTRELFAQLDKKNPTNVADVRSNYAGTTFRLRYSYVRETYGHENFGSKVRYVPTGGMLLTWHVEGIPAGYSKVESGEVRIKPDTNEKQQKAVSRAITRILRIAKNERMRIWHVEQVDALCKPYGNDPAFHKFVDKWEKKDGKTSDYQSLTREECEVWIARIKDWKKGLNAVDFYTEHDCPKCGEHFSTCICEEPQYQVEGTLANFDRYIAGDR